MNKQEKEELISFIEKEKENITLKHGKYSQTHFGFIWGTKLIEFIEQLDEPQKVKVPECVAGYIVWCHSEGLTLWEVFKTIRGMPEKVWEWLKDEEHQAIFSKAYTDGYEVEEEPLFYIRLTIPSSSVVGLYLGFNKDGIFDHSYGKPHVTWDWKCTFTEHEIKSIDERYWPFAVPVEKV